MHNDYLALPSPALNPPALRGHQMLATTTRWRRMGGESMKTTVLRWTRGAGPESARCRLLGSSSPRRNASCATRLTASLRCFPAARRTRRPCSMSPARSPCSASQRSAGAETPYYATGSSVWENRARERCSLGRQGNRSAKEVVKRSRDSPGRCKRTPTSRSPGQHHGLLGIF